MSQAPSVAFAGSLEDSHAEETANVSLKGTTRGLEILISGTPSATALGARLTQLLAEAPGFFAGSHARVAIDGVLPVGALACLEEVAARFELRIVELGPVARRARDLAPLPSSGGPVLPAMPPIPPLPGTPALLAMPGDDAARSPLAEGTRPFGGDVRDLAVGGPVGEAGDGAPSGAVPGVAAASRSPGGAAAGADQGATAPEHGAAAAAAAGDAAVSAAQVASAAPDAATKAAPPANAPGAAAASAVGEAAIQAMAAKAASRATVTDDAATKAASSAAVTDDAAAKATSRATVTDDAAAKAASRATVTDDAAAKAASRATVTDDAAARAAATPIAPRDAAARARPSAAPSDPGLIAALAAILVAAGGHADEPAGPRLVIGPVRSGRIVDHVGHLIVIGDVNPGAEVRAEGSIIVLGRLRGVAHAAIGRDAGCIIALSFAPQQLRIGRMVARAGDADRPGGGAEIAYATGETIVVERFLGRLPSGLAASM